MKYVNLDGTEFTGPIFNPAMAVVDLSDGKVYATVFDNQGEPLYRKEVAVGEDGLFIWEDER